MTAYSDAIRRWVADDRRAGTLEHADGIGEVGLKAGEAGKRLAVRFALRLRGDRVDTVRYQVFGCGFTIAACAAAAELAEGHALTEVAAITPAWVDAALAGLPPERDYCAALAVEALQAAVKSAGGTNLPVQAAIQPAGNDGHAPRVWAADPFYRLLIDSPVPPGIRPEDRHLFACLLTVSASETGDTAGALGLSEEDLAALRRHYFPEAPPAFRKPFSSCSTSTRLQANPDILNLLLTHLPQDDDGWTPAPSLWLARCLAARAAHPGHLWIAMGLFSRPELTAAITRHLPSLAAANNKGMRWKRFFFRQLCEQSGGMMCRTPECGECSDYGLCFGEG